MQPALYAACEGEERLVSHWLLDKDSKPRIKSGVIQRLVRHIDNEVIKETRPKDSMSNVNYDVCLVTSVSSAIVRFGSSHTFALPLFETRFSRVSANASCLFSSLTGRFVPENELTCAEEDVKLEDHKGNHVQFETNISALYLNTKHNHMECFIEPYPSYGSLAYKGFPVDSPNNDFDDHNKGSGVKDCMNI